jgi:CheY-like chemotaxis protein
VELNLEVRSVCKLLERSIPKMISIELHLAERLKIINADPAQLEQIMMNLGVNARDAMPDGGNLIFETENVILDEEYCKTHLEATTGEYVMLSVSDTGNGMEKEIAEHIFEPFYTTKETGKGTGLGLSTVYGIVKRHGGNVNCYSESGHGATFKIYFPVIEQERAVAEEKEVQVPVSGGNETILLVDDEESIRELGEDILVRFGYTVVTASDGESALEIYRRKEQKIDLVVLDLIMPGMGGRRCLEEILKIDSEATVIIASGYSANGKVKEALESGAVEFIGKPYNIKDMLRKVRNVLDK